MQRQRSIYKLVADPPRGTLQPLWANRPEKPKDDPHWDRCLPHGPRADLGNEANGVGSGFPEGMATPILQFDQAFDHSKLVDIILLGSPAWILSDRAKEVFERLDPEALEFRETESVFANEQKGPTFWLCEVVRFIDAVEEERSNVYVQTITIERNDRRVKRVSHGFGPDVFRASAVGDAHVFRPFFAPFDVFCDQTFVAAIVDRGLSGMTPWLQGALAD